MRHVQAQLYGSSRQQDVDIRDKRARLSSWMCKRSGEMVVSTTDADSNPNATAVFFDSGYPRASCRQINTGNTGMCLDPTSYSYQHFLVFWASAPHKSGAVIVFGKLHPQIISLCLNLTEKGAMIKISEETNGPSASWQHPVLLFGR